MKKTLLSLMLVCFSFISFSQLKINEIYQISDTSSGTRNRQFFELALHPTIKQQQNSDSYVLLSYFKTATDSGFYVLDLPSKMVTSNQDTTMVPGTINAGGFFVGAPDSSADLNKFVYQNDQTSELPADFYWKRTTGNASIKKFKYQAGTWVEDPNPSFDKIFSFTTADSSRMVVFLYRKTTSSKILSFVDVFVATTSTDIPPPAIRVPNEIFKYNDLKFRMRIGAPTFNDTVTMRFNDTVFKSRNSNPAGVNAASTTDEGFFSCGGWGVLPSNSTTLTPDKTNTTMLGEQFEAKINCPGDVEEPAPTSVSISLTKGEQSALPVRLQIYADKNGDRKLDQGDILRYTSPEPEEIDGEWVDSLINSLGATYYLPNAKAADDLDIIVVMKANGTCYDAIVPVRCEVPVTTPVSLLSFDAQRSGSSNNVLLNWKTASEFNNKGFYIQRRFGDRENWYPVAFIGSKAPDGSNGYSNTALSYYFTDANPSRVVTQYRLMQVDNDGKASFSQIRSVQGLEQAGKILIYPVPSTSGVVNVIFEDAVALRNVAVSDMMGRTLMQWKGVANGSMQISNLAPGLYSIRILNTKTNRQTIARIIVIR